MDQYGAAAVCIISFILIISMIILIIKCIKNHNIKVTRMYKSGLPIIKHYVCRYNIKPTDNEIITYNDMKNYLNINRVRDMIFYEYEIKNTIFPKDIENIVKEYIHYRIIFGVSYSMLYQLNYPYKISFRFDYEDEQYKLLENKLYHETSDGLHMYKLNFKGGFKIQSNNALDIKIE